MVQENKEREEDEGSASGDDGELGNAKLTWFRQNGEEDPKIVQKNNVFTSDTGSESRSEQQTRHEESTKTKTKQDKVAEQVSGGEHESAGMYVCITYLQMWSGVPCQL